MVLSSNMATTSSESECILSQQNSDVVLFNTQAFFFTSVTFVCHIHEVLLEKFSGEIFPLYGTRTCLHDVKVLVLWKFTLTRYMMHVWCSFVMLIKLHTSFNRWNASLINFNGSRWMRVHVCYSCSACEIWKTFFVSLWLFFKIFFFYTCV